MKHTLQISSPEKRLLSGSIRLNGSKSISNRVLVIQALCAQDFNIENLSEARDTELLQKALSGNHHYLDVGAGGTTYRFLAAYLASRPGEYILTGSDRMKERPVKVLVEALNSLGADITYLEQEGFPPLRISGKIDRGGKVVMPGDVSSQFLTALLLIAPTLKGGVELQWTGTLVSRPYVQMTLNLMEHFGIDCSMDDHTIRVKEGSYIPRDFYVEGDWSAASYFYSIAALSDHAEIELQGLDAESVQGDSVIAFMMEGFGVSSEHNVRERSVLLKCRGSKRMPVFQYDFLECPDLAQTIAAMLTGLGINGSFTGLETLKIKETDRVAALRSELGRFGADLNDGGEGLWLLDCARLRQPATPPVIRTYEDHRMAMALAPLCLTYGRLIMENPGVVAKSYPGFWSDLEQLGFKIDA